MIFECPHTSKTLIICQHLGIYMKYINVSAVFLFRNLTLWSLSLIWQLSKDSTMWNLQCIRQNFEWLLSNQFNYRSWWNQFKLELLTSIFRGNFAVYLPFVQTTKHLTAALLFQITTQQNRLLKGLQMGKQMTFCAKSLAIRLGYLSEILEHIL